MIKEQLDVIIIGGGPAGLNAALVFGRARKKVAVIDEGRPRNAVTKEMHGFLTRDGITPSEFRRIAQEEINVYPSVSFVRDRAVVITGTAGQFQIETAQGQMLTSKKILFTVGMKDEPLAITGLAEVYGKSAFVCPYCDGWELRDEPLVVITKGAELMHFAPLISGWSSQIIACTNGPDGLTDGEREELQQHQVKLFDSPIRKINSHNGIVEQVVLEDGSQIPCRGIFFQPQLVIGSELPRSIGCQLTEWGAVVVDEFGKTNIAGVYSAGDATSRMHQAITAAAMGAFVAAVISNELNSENWAMKG